MPQVHEDAVKGYKLVSFYNLIREQVAWPDCNGSVWVRVMSTHGRAGREHR